MVRVASFLLALLIAVSTASAETRVRLLDGCPDDRACLPATLNDSERPDEGYEVRVERKSPDDLGNFLVTVRGRLNGSSEDSYDLIFPVSGGELFCTDFVQSTVPWVGYSEPGNPILLTEEGNFELTSNSPVIGCIDCLRLRREPDTKPFSKFTTPAWDLAFTRPSAEDFTWTEDGQAYVKSGNACLRLARRDLFRFAPADRCARRAEFKGLNPETDMSEEGPDWILKIEGSNVTGHLYNGACT